MKQDQAKSFARTIPDDILDQFPDKGIHLGNLETGAAEAADIESLPITLERGDSSFGIAHLWTDHKDLFLNPDKASLILQETIGSPECRVVVSLKLAKTESNGHILSNCRKRIIMHNQKTGSYLVLRLADDGKSLQVVSFNRAPDSYGTRQWGME